MNYQINNKANENLNMIRKQDLLENPTPRVPVCLCLDTSGSMGAIESGDVQSTGEKIFQDGQWWNVVSGGVSRIDELKKGIEEFYKAIREDEVAYYSAEICIVTFDDKAECVTDFCNIDRQDNRPDIKASGSTAMGEGVELALELLEKRKQEYKEAGVDYFQPWLVIMTDGEASDAEKANKAAEHTAQMVKEKKLSVFPIGIGKEANMEQLNKFSPKRQAAKLQGTKFCEFFEWLGKSVALTSQSMPERS